MASEYARRVVAGKIPNCKWVKLAAARHLNDLKSSKSKDFPFKFDVLKANRACKFIEALPHTKGDWAARGETIKLEPWQCFIVCCLFGWVEKSSGRYRFREAYIKVPRKNAKSTLAAGIGLYKFAADNEYGSEVYSGATSEKQAWEVFRPAKLMAERTPALLKAFGITVNAKSLTIFKNGSRFEPIIGKPGDGASPSCAIADEYHEHPDDTLVETMRTGMGARSNPLLLEITTAGSDRSSPCYAAEKDAQQVLLGVMVNDRLFALMYGTDDGDDWKSPAVLAKANPNFGVSVDADFLRHEQQKATQSARLQNGFLTKHLNVWVNADVAWMNIAKWDASADPSLKLDDFVGQPCDIGVDFSSVIDIADKVRLFRRQIDGKMHYYAFATHYLNEGAVQESRGSHYQSWANDGYLVVTPGNVTDYGWLVDDLLKDIRQFRVQEIPHDPYQSQPLLQNAQQRPDWPKNQLDEAKLLADPTLPRNALPVAIPQDVKHLSAPMKELEAIVIDGRFHHDGDPVLTWMVSNVVCHEDAKGNVYPRKEKPENKIDGAVALIMALSRSMTRPLMPAGARSIFDSEGWKKFYQ